MHKTFLAAAILALFALRAPAIAAVAPYAKLANALGTSNLANSSGPKDRSQLLLHFVRRGETYERWTKMTTVSIVRVPAGDTNGATRAIILRLRARLSATHAHVTSFDQSPITPVSGYFAFRAAHESDAGIVYSPSPGYVTVAQLGVRGSQAISKIDIAQLRSVIGK